MDAIPIYKVDSFTAHAFTGNPAAVCMLERPAADSWMKAVAMEMNLSETAFLVPVEEGYHLRWFTPVKEVRLCGHATLASAHVLFETGALKPMGKARFHTLSGLLTAERRGSWIELDFPARFDEQAEPPESLVDALGVTPINTARHENIYLLELADERAVRLAQPDFTRLAALPVRSVMITARSNSSEYEIVSRYFAPSVGINEDPVTGSAHCHLAPYWAARLGRTEFTAYQASHRGGILHVQLLGERVKLAGQAVTVMAGQLYCW